MKKLILMSLVLAGSLAYGSSYTLDAAHSEVGFSVKHLMISNVKGRFDKYDATFQFDEAKNEISNVDVKIDASSINTNDKKRDDHLRSDDFFGVAKNPNITFKSDKSAKLTDKKAKVSGTLTIHGISKPATLDVEYGGAVKDAWGNDRVAFTADTQINRKDFGMNWNKALDKGGVTVSDEVKIHIDGEAIKDAPKKK